MKREQHRSVSVDDLLRLKRAERPLPGFWEQFDRRLREKQLSALLVPRPWWRSAGLAEWWQGFRRFHAPLGATFILAVTLISWQRDWFRENYTPETGLPDQPAVASKADGATYAGAKLAQDRADPRALVLAPDAVVLVGGARETNTGADVFVAEASAPLFPRDVPTPGAPTTEARESSTSWAASLEPATGVQNDVAEVQLSRSLLSSVARFETRFPTVRSPVEPLKQIAFPAERRGARILTAMVTVGSVENAMRTTERAASRISEERLYDQIQRFGARGAGVSVKF